MSKEYYNVDYELKCQGVARGIIRTREKSIFLYSWEFLKKCQQFSQPYISRAYTGGAVPCVFWVLGYRLRLMDVIASYVSLYPNVVKLITIQVRSS